jgi:hypothetical protein
VVPITYFGSAWATLGLMRSAPALAAYDREHPAPQEKRP